MEICPYDWTLITSPSCRNPPPTILFTISGDFRTSNSSITPTFPSNSNTFQYDTYDWCRHLFCTCSINKKDVFWVVNGNENYGSRFSYIRKYWDGYPNAFIVFGLIYHCKHTMITPHMKLVLRTFTIRYMKKSNQARNIFIQLVLLP